MKRILICLAFGLATMAAFPGGAQAAEWTGCGPIPAVDGSTTHVWVSNGGCGKAVGVVRASYERYEEFFESIGENPENGGGMSTSVGRFACDFDPGASPTVLRCENDPVLILGLKQAGSDPNEWTNPPVLTRTLTRAKAEGIVKTNIRMDDTLRPKQKLRVSCSQRLSRLSFRCRFSWSDPGAHVRGTARVTKNFRGSSSRYSYRYYGRKCLKAGGTLPKCELREKGFSSVQSSVASA